MQLVGRERQTGHHRVHAVIQQGRARFVPGQMQGSYLGVGMPVPASGMWRLVSSGASGLADDLGGIFVVAESLI